MDKNKVKKISIETKMFILLLIILIILLCIAYYIDYNKAKESQENKIVSTENLKEEKEDEDNKQEIINLIKECEEKTNQKGIIYEIKVSSIEKNNEDKYLIIANYNEPIEITKEQYENLIVSGSCEAFLEKAGTYSKNSKIFGEGSGYGFITIEEEEAGSVDYEIVKTDTGYSFRAPAGPGYPLTTQTEIKFYLEGKTKIYIPNEGNSILKEYYEELNQKLTSNEKPIVTVEYKDEEIYLNESAK